MTAPFYSDFVILAKQCKYLQKYFMYLQENVLAVLLARDIIIARTNKKKCKNKEWRRFL